jgi:hypothetical protein
VWTSSATCRDKFVRLSNIVSRIVDTCSVGLRCPRISSMFRRSWLSPSRA